MQQQEYDLVIVGGGLVGASLALALQPLAKKLDWKICLVENQPPNNVPQISDWQPSFDARSTALAWGTRLIYERLGLWQDLEEHANPIEHIQITDRGFLGATQLHNTEQQVAALGYVVPNIWLGKVLWQGLAAAKNTQVLAPAVIHYVSFPSPEQALLEGELEDKPLVIKAKLVVLADGGRSGIKQQLGIADAIHDYEQTAIIANVRMSKPHQGWAYERFATDGPMALLPLAGRDMALVWTRTNEQAATDAVLGDAEFLQAIQQDDARVLIMRADVGRDFLSEQLQQRGIKVDFLPLYCRRLPVYPSDTLITRIQQEQLNGLVVSSEQGLRHLIELAGEAWPQLASLALFVPSPRVAQIARKLGAQHVIDCKGASNQAVLNALNTHAAPIA